MCSDSEAGSYVRRIDLCHPTLGSRAITKKRREFEPSIALQAEQLDQDANEAADPGTPPKPLNPKPLIQCERTADALD